MDGGKCSVGVAAAMETEQLVATEVNLSGLWQDIAAWVENLAIKVCHIDAHMVKSCATKEHRNNEEVD